MKPLRALSIVCLLVPLPVSAASSDWFQTEGARLRLVTEEAADAAGRLRGALVIELEPGWKTYWKDPGDAGIAPQIDVGGAVNVETAEISFPPPGRYGEGNDVWAGYSGSVSLPVTFKLADPQAFAAIDADLFLGVCREICIPVQARLSAMPSGDTSVQVPEVAQAFAALASPAVPEFGLTSIIDDGTSLRVAAALPDASGAELFVASPPGWALRAPVLEAGGPSLVFVVPIANRPAPSTPGTVFDYTLKAAGKAVDGSVKLP